MDENTQATERQETVSQTKETDGISEILEEEGFRDLDECCEYLNMVSEEEALRTAEALPPSYNI